MCDALLIELLSSPSAFGSVMLPALEGEGGADHASAVDPRQAAPDLCSKIIEVLRKKRKPLCERLSYLNASGGDGATEVRQQITAIDTEVATLHAAAGGKLMVWAQQAVQQRRRGRRARRRQRRWRRQQGAAGGRRSGEGAEGRDESSATDSDAKSLTTWRRRRPGEI